MDAPTLLRFAGSAALLLASSFLALRRSRLVGSTLAFVALAAALTVADGLGWGAWASAGALVAWPVAALGGVLMLLRAARAEDAAGRWVAGVGLAAAVWGLVLLSGEPTPEPGLPRLREILVDVGGHVFACAAFAWAALASRQGERTALLVGVCVYPAALLAFALITYDASLVDVLAAGMLAMSAGVMLAARRRVVPLVLGGTTLAGMAALPLVPWARLVAAAFVGYAALGRERRNHR